MNKNSLNLKVKAKVKAKVNHSQKVKVVQQPLC